MYILALYQKGMKMKTYFLIGVCFLGLATSAFASIDPFSVYSAQAPEGCLSKEIGKEKLDLSDLIQIGICNNPSLNRSYMAIKTAESDVGQVKSGYLPTISASASADKDYGKVQNGISSEDDPYSANVALKWLLYDFGGRSAKTAQTKAYLDAAEFSYNSALQNLVFSISQAYYNLQGAKAVLTSSKTAEESYKKSYDETKRRYELGLVSASDKLLAQTSYENSKLAVIQAENAVKTGAGNLAQLLNLAPDTQFELARPKPKSEQLDLEVDKPVAELIEIALAQRPDLQADKSSLEASKYNEDVAFASALPSVSVGAGVGYRDNWRTSNPYNYSTNVGISLSVPLFTGFSDTYKITKAKYQTRQAEASVADTEDTVKNEVWTAYQDYQTAVSSHKISLTVLESAKENQKVAFAMYKVGKGSILNLLTAESQLANSRKESIVSFYSVLTQKAKLYRAIGRYN